MATITGMSICASLSARGAVLGCKSGLFEGRGFGDSIVSGVLVMGTGIQLQFCIVAHFWDLGILRDTKGTIDTVVTILHRHNTRYRE